MSIKVLISMCEENDFDKTQDKLLMSDEVKIFCPRACKSTRTKSSMAGL